MTTFLLLSTFLLHAISLLAIILLFTRQNRLLDIKNQQQKLMDEMEEMMSAYLLEIQEENEKFIQQVTNQKTKTNDKEIVPSAGAKSEQPAEPAKKLQPEILVPNMQRALAAKRYQSKGKQEEVSTFKPVRRTPSEEDDLLTRIKYFQEEGLTNQEIAKKLNKGKTEIELALKFNQNGE
ncbi:myosin heavy subunit [Bacillus ectoiniformans]|uniref:hypothetical protein n=1 Tax=Bacillus ectoiniformans TaxID=1494429 RepID=UPI0019595248|nr:hypothetical protein [Bacillus ectoiniformans]MBM7647103.1 myosin heavy subunit [Bacillus ectoiniformans]